LSESLYGRLARVSGRVAAGTVGEVTISIRGGTEAYLAHPADSNETFSVGTWVVITAHSGRTVFVAAADL
jgi:hypothetical protein